MSAVATLSEEVRYSVIDHALEDERFVNTLDTLNGIKIAIQKNDTALEIHTSTPETVLPYVQLLPQLKILDANGIHFGKAIIDVSYLSENLTTLRLNNYAMGNIHGIDKLPNLAMLDVELVGEPVAFVNNVKNLPIKYLSVQADATHAELLKCFSFNPINAEGDVTLFIRDLQLNDHDDLAKELKKSSLISICFTQDAHNLSKYELLGDPDWPV